MSKKFQLEIILKYNPMHDDYHLGIRREDDIKTFQEALNIALKDGYDLEEGFTPDYDGDIIQNALKTGKITVYSSYPIEQGTFVTPSAMEAQSYAGKGRVYSKEVDLDAVAWIDGIEGQYANIEEYKKEFINYDLEDHMFYNSEHNVYFGLFHDIDYCHTIEPAYFVTVCDEYGEIIDEVQDVFRDDCNQSAANLVAHIIDKYFDYDINEGDLEEINCKGIFYADVIQMHQDDLGYNTPSYDEEER